jgi:hypothetical protein
MRAILRTPALLALVLVGTGIACENQRVGRPCELGTAAPGGSSGQIATLSSPALECPSRICLLPAADSDPRSKAQQAMGVPGTGPLCTAGCASDADCEGGELGDASNPADTRCRNGFACMWPTTVGDFACQRLCVCRDFVFEPTGGFQRPAACN